LPGDPEQLVIEPVLLDHVVDKTAFVKRRSDEREYGSRLAARVASFDPEVVLSANTPLESQARLIRLCQRRGIRFVNWVQDAYGTAAHRLLRKRMGPVGGVVGRYYLRMERRQLLESDFVVVICDDFLEMTDAAGVAREATEVLPNWAPIDELPVREKDNAWARSHGLHASFNFVYSGTLGMKHDPRLLFSLARHFDQRGDVRVVVVSAGEGAEWLRERARVEGVSSLRILPFQPAECVPDVLAAGDVLVAILEPDAGTFSVPSKILSYLCAGRPLLLGVPESNLAARTVLDSNTGLVAEPDETRFIEAAERLFVDDAERDAMAARARIFAERNFEIGPIADRFELLLWGARILR
jgi:glycosyltransferase involved in cell wall biosynthesis